MLHTHVCFVSHAFLNVALHPTILHPTTHPNFTPTTSPLRSTPSPQPPPLPHTGGPGTWVTRTYTATRNGGAFMNGTPLCVSRTKTLDQSLLVTDWPSPVPDDMRPQVRVVHCCCFCCYCCWLCLHTTCIQHVHALETTCATCCAYSTHNAQFLQHI